MEAIVHRSETRGHFNYGWLDTRHTFSFARYHNPERMNFGALRVLNDDIVLPGEGFGRHPHDNMEIISIPLKGALEHEDSMGHKQVIHENEVQVMSAGTGLFHSEYNSSSTDLVNFLQLWIIPAVRNIKPVYDQKLFDPNAARDQWQLLVSAGEGENLQIHQNARISRIMMSKGSEALKSVLPEAYGTYFFLISGKVSINGEVFEARDGVGITGIKDVHIEALEESYLLAIEVPA